MRRTGVLLIAVVALLASAAVAQGATVYFAGAVGGRHVRPRTLALSADGTLEVTRVRWRSWGGRTGVGHGRAEYHGCRPSCAAARPHHATVTVRLSRIRSCSHRRYYTRVTLTRRSGKLLRGDIRRVSWKPCR